MWKRTYSTVTKEITGQQLWKLFADVNNWHTWDKGIEFARLEGRFEKGNFFMLRPKGGPTVKIELIETIINRKFTDVTRFPLAKMTDEHLFEETKDGLRITNTIFVEGILSFLWIRLVANKIVQSLPEDIRTQIKAASKL